MVLPAEVPRLVTERLVLRALESADVPAIFGLFADPEAMRYWSSGPWTDPAPAVSLVERAREMLARGEAVRWGIERTADRTLVGTCTLFSHSPQNRRAELGYILGRPHWGQGYMREALGAVLEWAFGSLGLIRVEADVDPRNHASLRTLEHFGFVREGLLRKRWIVDGETCDSVLLGLLADERS